MDCVIAVAAADFDIGAAICNFAGAGKSFAVVTCHICSLESIAAAVAYNFNAIFAKVFRIQN